MTSTPDDLLEFIRVVRNLTGRKLNQTDAATELEALAVRYAPEPHPELANLPHDGEKVTIKWRLG